MEGTISSLNFLPLPLHPLLKNLEQRFKLLSYKDNVK